MKRMLPVALPLFLAALVLWAQPQVSYIIPDIGTPGMNTYVEIIAPITATGSFGAESMSAPSAITVEFVNRSDSGFIVVSPVVVGWEGRLISCQFFVKPYAPLRPYPFRVRVNGAYSNIDTFFVQGVQAFGFKTGGGVIGSGGAWGRRSKRGGMIVDSMTLAIGIYNIDTQTDPDPGTPGNQAYLPAIIISKGPIRILSGAAISGSGSGKNGGPGGGGGGGYGSGIPPLIPGEKDTPLGSGFTGGQSNIPIIPSPASSFGQGSGANSASLNGARANSTFTTIFPTFARLYGAGPGHPFDSDGRSGGGAATTGGSGLNTFGTYFGGGGNATTGGGLPPDQNDINGQIIGNKEIVPLHGGGGGSSGGPNDSVGAGGGGGVALYSQTAAIIAEVRANGANGANGCNNCGLTSGDAAGGGAAGSIIVGSKLPLEVEQIELNPGRAGLKGASAPANSTSGSGGAGRFRNDGRIVSGRQRVTAGSTRSTGPTIDTLTYVTKPIFTVSGTGSYTPGGKPTPIQVFVRGESLQWNYASPYNAIVQPDSTWQAEVAITTTDSLLYIFAVQLTDPDERQATDQWTRIPTHIFSQGAANIVRYRPAPDLRAPASFDLNPVFCQQTVLDTIVISNAGAGVLEITGITSTKTSFAILSPASFPRTVNPGKNDTIIIQFGGPTAPDGESTAEIVIVSNDPDPGKQPLRIPIRAFKVRYEYIDPTPDNPPTIDFGEVRVGSSIDRTIEIRNINSIVSTTLLIDSLWVSPPTPSILTLSRSIPKDSPIPPGSSLLVEVRYSPTVVETLGPVMLCARIKEPCFNTICFPLTGKGVLSAIATSKPSLSMRIPPCSPVIEVDDTVLVTNTGSSILDLLALTVSPAGTFRVLGPTVPPTLKLPPGASAEVIVRYTPGTASRETGSLVIVTNDPDVDSVVLNIRAEWDSAGTELSAKDVGLYSLCPGTQIDSTVRIKNTGTVETTVQLEYATGTGPFSISPLPATYTLQPGEEKFITLSYTPTASGLQSATLLVKTEPCGLVDSIVIKGDLTPPNYSVQPQPLAFGDIRTGSTTQRTATVDNSAGLTNIRVISARIVPPTPELVISSTQPFPIGISAGGSGSISLDYTPAALGELPPGTQLEVIIDQPCPDTIRTEVTGRGVNGLLLANPSPLDFGSVYPCMPEVDTITIQNISQAPITILGLQVDPTPGEFTAALVDPSIPTPQLGPNESLKILVRFDAGAPPDGQKTATLRIATNDSNTDTLTVPLRGRRLSESLALAGPGFAPTFAGGSDVRRRFIINNSTSVVAVSNLSVDPPFKVIQTIPSLSHLLAPGDTLIVDLEFAPAAEGTYEDTIEVTGLTICGPIRLPISGVSPTALFADAYWEGMTGAPGETILLPLQLTADVTGLGITEYDVDLRFNKTMLFPQRIVLNGTLSDDWIVAEPKFDTGSLSFRAIGSDPLAGSGTLAYVEMLVLLGNALSTPLESSDTTQFRTGGARMKVAPGLFTLEGYCDVGGNRLVRVTNNFGIKTVAPNPARDRIAVDIELVEDGPTRLALYDPLGRRVAILLDGPMAAQPHHVEAQLQLPQGVYFLELTTPTQRQQVGVTVGR